MNTLFRRFWHGQDGQVLYLFAALLVVLLGMAALSIDIGFAIHAQRELQASADAAATAGAIDISNNLSADAAYQTAYCYSGVDNNGFKSGGQASLTCPNGNAFGSNVYGDLPGVTMVSGYPQVKCLTTLQNQGMACNNAAVANAMAGGAGDRSDILCQGVRIQHGYPHRPVALEHEGFDGDPVQHHAGYRHDQVDAGL